MKCHSILCSAPPARTSEALDSSLQHRISSVLSPPLLRLHSVEYTEAATARCDAASAARYHPEASELPCAKRCREELPAKPSEDARAASKGGSGVVSSIVESTAAWSSAWSESAISLLTPPVGALGSPAVLPEWERVDHTPAEANISGGPPSGDGESRVKNHMLPEQELDALNAKVAAQLSELFTYLHIFMTSA